MTTPPAGPGGGYSDPLRGLRRTRNIIIGVIVVVALLAIVGSCASSAISGLTGGAARDYISDTYQRDPTLDEGDVDAYIADGSPAQVAADIAAEETPTDQRAGADGTGNAPGSQFLQYPDYLVGLFPYGTNQTRVMLSRDYRSGYNRYHSYVGGFWVPVPNFGGSGSDNRGGGSGGGGK